MKLNTLLSIVTAGIMTGSLISLLFEIIPHPWLRLGTSGIFFLFAVKIFPPRNYYGPILFFLLVVCDLTLFFWDYPLIKPGYYISHILAVSILIFLTVRELKSIKISKVEVLSILLFFGINTIILLLLGEYFHHSIAENWIGSLFYLNGFLILVLVLSAFLYSINFANDVSAFLFVAVMGLTISDLLLFGILFTDFAESKYVDNIFYSGALYFLLLSYLEHKRLSVKRKEEKKQLEVTEANKKPSQVYK